MVTRNKAFDHHTLGIIMSGLRHFGRIYMRSMKETYTEWRMNTVRDFAEKLLEALPYASDRDGEGFEYEYKMCDLNITVRNSERIRSVGIYIDGIDFGTGIRYDAVIRLSPRTSCARLFMGLHKSMPDGHRAVDRGSNATRQLTMMVYKAGAVEFRASRYVAIPAYVPGNIYTRRYLTKNLEYTGSGILLRREILRRPFAVYGDNYPFSKGTKFYVINPCKPVRAVVDYDIEGRVVNQRAGFGYDELSGDWLTPVHHLKEVREAEAETGLRILNDTDATIMALNYGI